MSETNTARLYRILSTDYDIDELRDICSELGIDYDSLPSTQEEDKLKTLVRHLEEHNQIPHLVSAVRQRRVDPPPVQNNAPSQAIPQTAPPQATPQTTPQVTPQTAPQATPRTPPKFDYTMFALAFALGTVFALLIFSLGVFPSLSKIVTVEVTRLVEVAVSQATPIPAHNTTAEDAPVQPTLAPAPTSTPEPTVSTTVFFDDFERGLAPEWQAAYGSMGMANGNLTVVSPFDKTTRNHLTILDDYIWQDFILTSNLASFYTNRNNHAYGGILVRQLADGQWVGVLIMPRDKGIAFATFDENGDFAIQSGSLVGGRDKDFSFRDRETDLRIEAYGNTYILYLDDKKITSATFPGPTSGRIALWAQNSKNEERSDSYAPRFEDIRIESAP